MTKKFDEINRNNINRNEVNRRIAAHNSSLQPFSQDYDLASLLSMQNLPLTEHR